MKTGIVAFVALLVALPALTVARAQGTAFTYQGRLQEGTAPANGIYDLRFTAHDAAAAGASVGTTLTFDDVGITNGLFSVTLDLGPIFDGAARWLEIAVRPGASAGSFTNLVPRQPITATPYAVTAGNFTGTVGAGQLSGTYTNALNLSNPANVLAGGGAGLTGLNATELTTGTVPAAALGQAWKLSGNTGTSPSNHFIGTLDAVSLTLRAGGQRGWTLQPDLRGGAFDAVSLVGGSSANAIHSGIGGAAIVGGGFIGGPNTIEAGAHGGFIGAGSLNTISSNANDSVIGGGFFNRATRATAVVGGGFQNTAGGDASGPAGDSGAVLGGYYNAALGNNAFVGAGVGNTNSGNNGALPGGYYNSIHSTASEAVLSGGLFNRIVNDSHFSTLAGGRSNQIAAQFASIGGGDSSAVQTGASNAVISGGQGHLTESFAKFSSIGGGQSNRVGFAASFSSVGGGQGNIVEWLSTYGVIGGGEANRLGTNSRAAFIGGGESNRIGTAAAYSSIIGGFNNLNDGDRTVIGGGSGNTVNGGNAGVIGGGSVNQIAATNRSFVIVPLADGAHTIAGGSANLVFTNSRGAAIGGGVNHTVPTGGDYATIPGGYQNTATNNALAAGTFASAVHSGAFVWADKSASFFHSQNTNEFAVRAGGGVRFVTAGAGVTLDSQPILSAVSTNQVRLTNAGNQFAGTGAGLTGVNAAQLDGLDSTNFWRTGGNTLAGGEFIGSANTQPLVLRANGQRGWMLQPDLRGGANDAVSLIGGSSANAIHTNIGGAAIVGGGFLGGPNVIESGAHGSFIGAGSLNTIASNATDSVIGGGFGNRATRATSVVGGGYQNTASGNASGVAGDSGAVLGGYYNAALGNNAFIGAGLGNTNAGNNGAISGGGYNFVDGSITEGTLGGGAFNSILADSDRATIGGGASNRISGGMNSVIGGGEANLITGSSNATISGGFANLIDAQSGAVIAGGTYNTNGGRASFIGAGRDNRIATNQINSLIVGGFVNVIGTPARLTTAGVSPNQSSVIGGGAGNYIPASNLVSTIGGGLNNETTFGARAATVPGGEDNEAASYAFAAGRNAKATNQGAFVWSDSSNASFGSTDTNQFLVRASGGVGINTNNPDGALHVHGTTRLNGLLRSGSEVGTGETPSPAGLVVRRVNSITSATNEVVARTDDLTLERDGTAGGFLIRYPANSGMRYTIAFQGINSAGANVNYYTNLLTTGTGGTLAIYANAQNVVNLRGSFGRTYTASQHLTEIALTRWGTDNYWSGTLTSTFNQ